MAKKNVIIIYLNSQKYIKFFLLSILLLYNLFIKKTSYFKSLFYDKKRNRMLFKQKHFYQKYRILTKKPFNKNDSLFIKEKRDILKMISLKIKKNVYSIKNIYFNNKCRFGNCLIGLNKILFYCEIINFKKIILDKKIYWFIKNKIILKNQNLIIISEDFKNLKKYNNLIIYTSNSFFFSFFNIKPEIRINYIRNELIKNLPKIKLSEQELYIHIRSGDIFQINPLISFSQPPLCFYQKIINNFQFNNIYIITSDTKNPVIQYLVNNSSNVIYKKNELKIDISLLINAYNVVASISSFLNCIIQLNYNLKNIWDYNLMKLYQKIIYYHYDLYDFPKKNFSIYRMEPSIKYKKTMFIWKNNKKQRKLMIKEKCFNQFKMIKN